MYSLFPFGLNGFLKRYSGTHVCYATKTKWPHFTCDEQVNLAAD